MVHGTEGAYLYILCIDHKAELPCTLIASHTVRMLLSFSVEHCTVFVPLPLLSCTLEMEYIVSQKQTLCITYGAITRCLGHKTLIVCLEQQHIDCIHAVQFIYHVHKRLKRNQLKRLATPAPPASGAAFRVNGFAAIAAVSSVQAHVIIINSIRVEISGRKHR
jgi:hypothetical protein